MTAGRIRKRLRSSGEFAYNVVESRMAPMLRRKSTAKGRTVYGSKKD
jgi:hypothetical protein